MAKEGDTRGPEQTGLQSLKVETLARPRRPAARAPSKPGGERRPSRDIAPERERLGRRRAMKGALKGECTISTHFGEILQGRFARPGGGIVRGLVTLRCPKFTSTVTVFLTPGDGDIQTSPSGRLKTAEAVLRTLRHLGVVGMSARVVVNNNIPMGLGAGSSTADVVATVYATAAALARPVSEAEVAAITVDTEKASDPTMFLHLRDHTALFAQREGHVLERVAGTMPRVEVVGIELGPRIDTVDLPVAEYTTLQITAFEALLTVLRKACETGDAGLLGWVATESAKINETHLPKEDFDDYCALAERHGAVGISVSHSGSAFAFLFDAGDALRKVRIEALLADLAARGKPVMVHYEIGGPIGSEA